MSNNIFFESTDIVMKCHFELVLFNKLFYALKLDTKLSWHLPQKKKMRGISQIQKIKSILFSFALGNDCLSDLDPLLRDPLFSELTSGGLHSRTAGDFLGSFHQRQIEKIQKVILEMAIILRKKMLPDDNDFILSMDSTPHKQCGLQMEKLATN